MSGMLILAAFTKRERLRFIGADLHCVKSVCIRSSSGPSLVRMRENKDQNNSE